MIHLARELDLQVVAEGVETEEQASFLKAHGVEYAQGWLYVPAMTGMRLFNAQRIIRIQSQNNSGDMPMRNKKSPPGVGFWGRWN